MEGWTGMIFFSFFRRRVYLNKHQIELVRFGLNEIGGAA